MQNHRHSRKKIVLITGAAGFLGKECEGLFKEKGYEVITTDKMGASVDIAGNLVDEFFASNLPMVDVVVNCAAVQYVSSDLPFFFRKKYFFRNNVISAKNLAERYKNSGTHFIHVGTSMMYLQNGIEHIEHLSQMKGDGLYSESKLEAQRYINKIKGSATVIPCIIGGHGREGLFRGFVNSIKKICLIIFPGKGTHKVHMVHVKDVASLIYLIANKKASGFFNAAGPEPLTIEDWASEVAANLQIKNFMIFKIPLMPVKFISGFFKYRFLAKEQLLMLEYQHVLNIQKSLKIGWEPKYSNREIISDITDYISKS